MKFNKKMYSTLVNQYVHDYKNDPDTLLELLNAQYDDMVSKSVTDTSYPLNKVTYDAMYDAYDKIVKEVV